MREEFEILEPIVSRPGEANEGESAAAIAIRGKLEEWIVAADTVGANMQWMSELMIRPERIIIRDEFLRGGQDRQSIIDMMNGHLKALTVELDNSEAGPVGIIQFCRPTVVKELIGRLDRSDGEVYALWDAGLDEDAKLANNETLVEIKLAITRWEEVLWSSWRRKSDLLVKVRKAPLRIK